MCFLRKHIIVLLFYLIISRLMMAEDSTTDDHCLLPPIVKHFLTNVLIPLDFYYCVKIVKYYAKFQRSDDRLPLKEERGGRGSLEVSWCGDSIHA